MLSVDCKSESFLLENKLLWLDCLLIHRHCEGAMRKLFPSRFPLIIRCSLRYSSSGTVSSDPASLSELFIHWYLRTCSNWRVCWNAFFFFCSAESQSLVALHIYTVFNANQLHSGRELYCQSRLLWLKPTRECGEEALYPGVPRKQRRQRTMTLLSIHSTQPAFQPRWYLAVIRRLVKIGYDTKDGLKKKYSPHLSFPFYETE